MLVDDAGHAVLADFGLATFSASATETASSLHGGATAWLAPELSDPESFGLTTYSATFSSDVYSYACVCWEVCSPSALSAPSLIRIPGIRKDDPLSSSQRIRNHEEGSCGRATFTERLFAVYT